MNLIASLFLGFVTAFVGITPPGLINMTAAKVNLKEGKRSAFWFVLGAVIVIFFQATLAILFAQFIKEHPEAFEDVMWVLFDDRTKQAYDEAISCAETL